MKSSLDICRTAVFMSEIPEGLEIKTVVPSERDADIAETSNGCAKREKYFVWRLLEHALSKSRGISINEVEFKKGENGRWTAKGFDFSLSHSKYAAAVVISDAHCGIDIEAVCAPKAKNFAKRILTDAEYTGFTALAEEGREEYLIEKWTRKEALFKARRLSTFIPGETVEQSGEFVKTEKLIISGKKYFCSVAVLSECEKVDFVILDAQDLKF